MEDAQLVHITFGDSSVSAHSVMSERSEYVLDWLFAHNAVQAISTY